MVEINQKVYHHLNIHLNQLNYHSWNHTNRTICFDQSLYRHKLIYCCCCYFQRPCLCPYSHGCLAVLVKLMCCLLPSISFHYTVSEVPYTSQDPYHANYPISFQRTIPSLFLVLCLRRYFVIGVIISSVSPPQNLAFHWHSHASATRPAPDAHPLKHAKEAHCNVSW